MLDQVYKRPRVGAGRANSTDCQDCGEALIPGENWTASMQRYRRFICRVCWRVRQRRYEANNPNAKEEKKRRAKEYRDNLPAEVKQARYLKAKESRFLREYGITLADYAQMLESQENACAICETLVPTGKGGFHVDHCHASGEVRGLLCSQCNMMLGLIGDDIGVLMKAINYLMLTDRADHKIENRLKDGG